MAFWKPGGVPMACCVAGNPSRLLKYLVLGESWLG